MLRVYLRQVYGFTYRQTHNIAKSPIGIFEIVVWPLASLFSIGFLGSFVDVSASTNISFVTFILIGQCGWSFSYVVQQALSYGLMHSMWSGTLIDMMASPADENQFIIGNALAGVIKGVVVLAVMGVCSLVAFNVNIFAGGVFAVFLIIFSVFLAAVSLGLIVLILIFYFGQEAQVTAWTITGLTVLFSGVFYPVTILPPLIRPLSYSIPLTYAFIAWREITLQGASMADVSFVLLQMGVSSVLWLVITWSVCLFTIKRARKIGMISQLSD